MLSFNSRLFSLVMVLVIMEKMRERVNILHLICVNKGNGKLFFFLLSYPFFSLLLFFFAYCIFSSNCANVRPWLMFYNGLTIEQYLDKYDGVNFSFLLSGGIIMGVAIRLLLKRSFEQGKLLEEQSKRIDSLCVQQRRQSSSITPRTAHRATISRGPRTLPSYASRRDVLSSGYESCMSLPSPPVTRGEWCTFLHFCLFIIS